MDGGSSGWPADGAQNRELGTPRCCASSQALRGSMGIAAAPSGAALSATPALPATEDSSAGDLVEALPGSTAGQWCTAYFNKHGFYPSIVQAFEAGASQAEVQAEPVADDYPHEQMDALALARYKVVPSDQSMYWRHAVVAGDGQQHIYNGSEVDCQNMARKFAGAFLDGAFAFHERRTAPQAQPSDALDAETTKKAARYDWLRSGNDYQSDGPMVVLYESEGDRGDRPYWSIASDALDASIDAAMAAAQDKRRILYTSPVATQGEQRLIDALQRARDWMDSQADSQSKGNHSSFDMLMLREERDAIDAALSATTPPVAKEG